MWIIVLTLTPTLELRASIPYAILVAEYNVVLAAVVGIAANTALAPVAWVFTDKVLPILLTVPLIKRVFDWYAQKKKGSLEGYVERYGVYGLALFIGVPFPGTGVYSGCLAAWLLGYRFRDYMVASFGGCVIAGIAVTVAVASGNEAFSFFFKEI